MTKKTYYSAILMILAVAAQTRGAVSIDVGNQELQANQPSQAVEFFVTGGDSVTGMEFDIEIGENAAGPIITNVDLKTGTIFSGSAFLQACSVRQVRATHHG